MPTDRNLNTFATITPAGPLPVVNSIFDFSADALAQLRLWLEQNPPAVPITSILGFAGFTFQPATTIDTQESTTSATYTDLATVGPVLSGLPDGQYAVFFGAQMEASGGATAVMSVDVNGTGALDADVCNTADANTSVSRLVLKTLKNNGSSTITAKYKTSNAGDTATFLRRWMIAVKYANA